MTNINLEQEAILFLNFGRFEPLKKEVVSI